MLGISGELLGSVKCRKVFSGYTAVNLSNSAQPHIVRLHRKKTTTCWKETKVLQIEHNST
jgi:hypothetical protein